MTIIRANHTNGNVKIALLRQDADVASTVESLKLAGYWLAIRTEPFAPAERKRRTA
jgi:hypothetical protein